MTYLSEFPDFDYDLPVIRGFHDDSWHNDVCPSLSCTLQYHTIHGDFDGATIKVWCDYADPKRRESMTARRYTIVLTMPLADENVEIAASDDWQTILIALRALRWLD